MFYNILLTRNKLRFLVNFAPTIFDHSQPILPFIMKLPDFISRLSALVAMLSLCLVTAAQRPLLVNYSPEVYNGGTQNWAIAFTPTNRILLANNHGLMSFDSRLWNISPTANYTPVWSVLCDSTRIFVGASNELGYYDYSDSLHCLHYHSLLPLVKGDKNLGEVWRVMHWQEQVVFQAKDRLLLLEDDLSRITTVKSDQLIESAAVIDGHLYVCSKQGAYELRNGRLEVLPGTEAIAGRTVRAILPFNMGLMLCCANGELLIYSAGTITPLHTHIEGFLRESQIFCATSQGDWVAVGTVRNGVVIVNFNTGATHFANMATGLRNNTVLAVEFDDYDNLWLGLDQGCAHVILNAPYSNLLGDNSPLGTGYTSLVKGNLLYLGTNQGVYATPYPPTLGPVPATPQPVVGLQGQAWSLRDIDGTTLCGNDNGAYVVRGTYATKIAGPEGTWNFVKLRRHPGLVLACDYRSLYLLRLAGGTATMVDRIKGIDVTSGQLIEDSDGSMWLCHWLNGVYHFWLSDDCLSVTRMVHYNSDNGLPVTEGNHLGVAGDTVYISSADGFHRINPATGKLELAPWLSRTFNRYGQALNLYEAANGDLWAFMAGFVALARRGADGTFLPADTLSYRSFCNRMQMSLGNFSDLDSTHTLLNSGNGFILADLRYETKRRKSKLMFDEIVAYGDRDTLVYKDLSFTNLTRLVLPHSRNSLNLRFVMPDFISPDEVLYQVYLEGYDHQWGSPNHIGAKSYTQLPSNTYTLHVRATNIATGEVEEITLDIVVQSAWYESWWAWIIYLLLTGLAIYGIYHYIVRREQRRLQLIAEENERQMVMKQREQEAQMREQQALMREQEAVMAAQQAKIEAEERQREVEQRQHEAQMASVRAERLEVELKHRSSELADSTMNLVRKNDMLQQLDSQMEQLTTIVWQDESKRTVAKRIADIRRDIQNNIREDENWEKFEESFNLVYDNFMIKLSAQFPDLKANDKKLCAYLRMGLSSKEMASLLNTSVRSIETARYRLRKKLRLDQGDNLTDFIQNL